MSVERSIDNSDDDNVNNKTTKIIFGYGIHRVLVYMELRIINF